MLRQWLAQSDEGAATAEFACVLPVVVVLAAVLLYVARASVVSLQCQDAAAAAAHVLIVENDIHASGALAAAQQVVGSQAQVQVAAVQGGAEVTVTCAVVPDPLGVLPTTVQARAVGILPAAEASYIRK
ncbi:TadE/TadG family type IV pilus assembly protein [Bifidobacterium dolichotidis]|nr:TadE/TadG family type IV pilus assembly protein [Bifidobacterium dolichotidis]